MADTVMGVRYAWTMPTYADLTPAQKAARAAYYREYHRRPDRVGKKRAKAAALLGKDAPLSGNVDARDPLRASG